MRKLLTDQTANDMDVDRLTTIDVYGYTWNFTPEAISTLRKSGVVTPKSLESFALRVLSMQLVRQGETEINFFGIGLRITQQGDYFSVDCL